MKLAPLAIVAAGAVLAACGSTSTSSSTATHATTDQSAAASMTTAVPASAPHRIVSMSPTATEMLFAIGAGPQVVAVDSDSNYPASVPKTSLSAYEPNAEAIARYRPDLVVIADDTRHVTAALKTLHIAVLTEAAATTLDDTYQQIEGLGNKTGHASQAGAVVARMRAKISSLLVTVPHRATPLRYYHELDNTLYTVTSRTFIGQLYSLAGLHNIADAVGGSAGGYPQLSAEFLVKANPDVVFLADTKCCTQSAKTFASRPGFATLQAVRNGHVVLLDDDVASRWGPRVVDFLQRIVDAVRGVPTS
jgi:iron complex transport system substrate-binding protein